MKAQAKPEPKPQVAKKNKKEKEKEKPKKNKGWKRLTWYGAYLISKGEGCGKEVEEDENYEEESEAEESAKIAQAVDDHSRWWADAEEASS